MTPHSSALRREHLDRIRVAAVAAVEPARAVARILSRDGDLLRAGDTTVPLAAGASVRLVAAGKAAAAMTEAAAAVLGERLSGGVLVTKYGHVAGHALPPAIEVFEAGHPVPDEAGRAAFASVEALLAGCREADVVVALLSGGASALLADPAEPIALSELQVTTGLLLRSGASIVELNAVRKHLSRLKGGQLARLATPATVVSLILSDVVGDPLDVIASGPTAPDPTTFADAWSVVERRGLADALPATVRARLRAGAEGRLPDTPKPGDPLFDRVHNVLVGSNRLAALAAVGEARALGYTTLLLSTFVEGEAREVARVAAALGRGVLAHGDPVPPPACLVFGGETTVTVRGTGRGGRNQELALAAALALEGIDRVSVMALATDGSDGPTDSSGAIVDGATAGAIRAAGLDPAAALAANDAYPALEAAGAQLRTGPTGTNVNDLTVILVRP
ncbi:MAG: glycerate kinase type-2 family protein [Thermoanaerobaculia bacterium]